MDDARAARTARAARRSASRRRRQAAGCLVAVLAGVLVLVGAVVAVVLGLRHAAPGPGPVAARCSAELDGTRWFLDPEQASNAATIAAVTVRRDLPARAATIALATAIQESGLRNLTYGDRDSLGLFQQRPSQGWGTAEEVRDPVYATNAFLDVLVRVEGWRDLDVTDAAQRVQRSAFPEAYGDHETEARAWASALTGYSPGAVTCTPGAESAPVPDVDRLTARITRDLGALPVARPERGRAGERLVVDARPLGAGTAADDERVAWAVAQWAVAASGLRDVGAVTVDGRSWVRGKDGWHTAPTATGSPSAGDRSGPGRGRVEITVATG